MRHRPRVAVRSSVLLGVGLILGGCAGGSEAASPDTTRTAETTITTAALDATEQAVVAAYEASWTAFGAFVNGGGQGTPADYFDGDQLVTVVDRVAQYADEGLELRGQADLAPRDVEVVGSAASLVDCQIDGTYAVERSTGDVVIPASARPQEVVVALVLADGRWKVSAVDYGAEGSCDR